ncbi:hypothetical protein Btru_006150 [Bulinus truncatus]|nr:hypothetical protein Btru_006150 [Bulinus truncatus]
MSRVQDTIKWKTLVEIRPPAEALNLAIVDYFIVKKYESALMIMPESAADNQECHNLAAIMLNNSLSLIPFTVDPRSSNIDISVQEVLGNAKLSSQTRIIVCSPRDSRDHLIRKVLMQARAYGMLHEPDMVFLFMDPASYYEPFSDASKMYDLRLFSRRCELLAYRYIRPEGTTVEENNAAAMDAARVTSLALNKYLLYKNSQNDTFDNNRFLKVIKETNFTDGRTGKVSFDRNGQRKNYNLYLYDHGGEQMYNTIAKWSPNGDLPQARLKLAANNETEDEKKEMGIMPKNVRIVVVEEDPFVIRKKNSNTDDLYEGFTIDLIKRLSRELKFSYEIYISPGNIYGAKNPFTGKWDGMVNEVLSGVSSGPRAVSSGPQVESCGPQVVNSGPQVVSSGPQVVSSGPQVVSSGPQVVSSGPQVVSSGLQVVSSELEAVSSGPQVNATLACGAISITSARETAIDFSLGVISTGVNILVKKPDEDLTIFQFMMPFSLELWMAILGASTLVTIVFFAMDYCSEEDRRFTLKETIWFTIGTLLKRGTDFAPVPISQRILTAGFLFFVLITVSTYTANMAAFLTIKNFGETVDSFETLAASKKMGVSTVMNSATMAFLKQGEHQSPFIYNY